MKEVMEKDRQPEPVTVKQARETSHSVTMRVLEFVNTGYFGVYYVVLFYLYICKHYLKLNSRSPKVHFDLSIYLTQ